MCHNCYALDQLFLANESNPHRNLLPTFHFIEAMFKDNRLIQYAGDCKFNDTIKLLNQEKHYTYCHYLECKECHHIFFFGICIRGTPIYKKITDIKKENIEQLLWGKEGYYFKK